MHFYGSAEVPILVDGMYDFELGWVAVNSNWGSSFFQSCEIEGWVVEEAGRGTYEIIPMVQKR